MTQFRILNSYPRGSSRPVLSIGQIPRRTETDLLEESIQLLAMKVLRQDDGRLHESCATLSDRSIEREGWNMAKQNAKRWSQRVTEQSNALDLDPGVFARTDPRSIARSLKRSAEQSRRRKSDPFRSAMSMLNFYINRAGKNLSKTRRARLEQAKEELRDLYHRERRAA